MGVSRKEGGGGADHLPRWTWGKLTCDSRIGSWPASEGRLVSLSEAAQL